MVGCLRYSQSCSRIAAEPTESIVNYMKLLPLRISIISQRKSAIRANYFASFEGGFVSPTRRHLQQSADDIMSNHCNWP